MDTNVQGLEDKDLETGIKNVVESFSHAWPDVNANYIHGAVGEYLRQQKSEYRVQGLDLSPNHVTVILRKTDPKPLSISVIVEP